MAPAKSAAALRDRSELTPTEKRAARSKERKKRKKASDAVKSYVSSRSGGLKGKSKTASAKKEKDDALRSLVKSGKGVTVVGKDSANLKRAINGGKGSNVGKAAGRDPKNSTSSMSAAALKL